MLSALVGARLSEVAYGPGTHWVEERTAKTSRSGNTVPARVGTEFLWCQVRAVPSHSANSVSILQLTNIFRSSLERMSGLGYTRSTSYKRALPLWYPCYIQNRACRT